MSSIALINSALLLGSGLVVLGILSSLAASRFGAPLLLVFLGLGMLVGENGFGVVFDDYRATYLIGSLALAVILFDGGLRTRVAELRGAVAPAVALATFGVLVTSLLTGLAAMAMLGLDLLSGLLVGSVVASTDAAAVFFLLRSNGLALRQRVNATLEIESSTNDPIAVFLVLALVELALAPHGTTAINLIEHLALSGAVGCILGLAGGVAIAAALNRLAFPAGLHPLFVIFCAIFIFAAASVAQGSGFLAVYLAGLVLGNRPVRALPSVISFHDAATWLSQIVMFLILGMLVTPSTLISFAVPGIAVAAFLMLVGRPVAVWLSLWPFRFSRSEKLFVSWTGLRGAVSIFLATIPMLTGVPNSAVYFNIAFFVVLVSLIVQGWSLPWTARRLSVALADPAPAVDRVEIDLPGQADLELVGYPVLPESPVLDHGRLPSWARPVLIVRGPATLTPEQAGPLLAGDYGYFLCPPMRVRRLDRLFAAFEGHRERSLAGVFAFPAAVRLSEIARAYSLDLATDVANQTLGELFADTFPEGVREGDRIGLGPVTLIARSVDDGAATAVTLLIDEADEVEASLGRVVLAKLMPRLKVASQGAVQLFGSARRRLTSLFD
ncbi:potassium/proton antiporter [Chelatococcus reniformis]|uniref:K+/H+ antiporter n=1 Tax=Chelatococcus reniformis TaxID=1494448 RepID=A0A916UMV4_9HYPH|nr:potassium/proton antiporter [Chelatococcus reniformis]GGC79668.1 K+/H+ antiporter [Chelatococcus reniformis]